MTTLTLTPLVPAQLYLSAPYPLAQISVYNVKDYGASGDNVADDTAEIQAALTAAALAGGYVVVPDGTYKVTSGLTVSSNTHILIAPGATIDFSAGATNMTLFTATGTLGTSVALTSNTTVNGTTLAFAAGSESSFAADDYVLVGSDAYFEDRTALYGAGTGQKIGEQAQVASTASGSLTLRAPLAGGFTADDGTATLIYKTTDAAFVRKVNQVVNVLIEGGTISGKTGSGTTASQIGATFQYCRDVTIREVRWQHIASQAVQFSSTVDFLSDNCKFYDNWNTSSGYGVIVTDASQDGEIRGGYSRNNRHGFTTGSNTGTYGIVRRITVRGLKDFNTINLGDGLDTHAGAEDIRFIDVEVFGSAEHGINIECASATVSGGNIQNAQKAGINIANFTFAKPRYTIIGPKIEDCGIVSFPGIRYRNNQGTNGSGRLQGSLLISTPSVINQGNDVAIDIEGHASYPIEGVVINGGSTENQNDVHGGLYLINCVQPTVGDIAFRRVRANQDGVRVNTCTKPSLANVTVNYPTAGTGVGISFIAVTDGSVTGGTVVNGGTGVKFDNASTYCALDGGNYRSCTTPISPGTGAGHKFNGVVHEGTVTAASAATLSPPRYCELVNVTGTADITSITADTADKLLILRFSSTAATNGVVKGSNLKINSNFVYTADDTLTLKSDGTNWYELGRSVN